jgi:hypothetical protein
MRFRRINPHINLPPQRSTGTVPIEANVRFVSEQRSTPVRFFVPRGATARLADSGYEPFDEGRTVVFDHGSFDIPDYSYRDVDREYATLVNDIRSFGFTFANRVDLDSLYQDFQTAYTREPTHFRWIAKETARLHRWVWKSRNFDELASVVETARSRVTIPAMAPAPLPERITAKPLGVLSTNVTRKP